MIEPHKFVSNCRVPGCTSAHYFCQVPECGVPATDRIHQHPAEGLSASQQDSLEYARGWVGHLDDNPIANDHNNCVIAAFEELAQVKGRIAELESKSLLKPATAPVLRGEKCICADSGIAKHFKIRSENNTNCPIHGTTEDK